MDDWLNNLLMAYGHGLHYLDSVVVLDSDILASESIRRRLWYHIEFTSLRQLFYTSQSHTTHTSQAVRTCYVYKAKSSSGHMTNEQSRTGGVLGARIVTNTFRVIK